MEDDQDELLQCSDEESLSENEENCLPPDNKPLTCNQNLLYPQHTKLEFIIIKLLLVFSTTTILILLPLYMDAINISGDVFSLILTNTTISTIILILSLILAKYFCVKYKQIKLLTMPLKWSKLIQLALIYSISALAIVYALDRKRVLCHLQDPIKGIVLVFSLLYYFFFCRKFMGLQRIFSATTIIVGLFIAVDYGLCDEFRCRGYARKQISDDTGNWSWHMHSGWTAVYICGLALFAAYFNLFERVLIISKESEAQPSIQQTSLLQTVSRTVSFPSTSNLLTSPPTRKSQENLLGSKEPLALHIACWLHIFSLLIFLELFWTDLIPTIGKASNFTEFLNYTSHGILCHFNAPVNEHITNTCGNLFWFSWIFIIAYVLYVVSSIRFLILSQSAIYTIASMTSALPITGIWWALFYVTPTKGVLVWSPAITGELICSLLGLPIIVIGLFLLCKAHFKDLHTETYVMSSNHLA